MRRSASAARIRGSAFDRISEQARRRLEDNVTRCARAFDAAGRRREVIDRRLEELDREWDIEWTLAANASAVSLFGLALAATVDRRWLYLPLGVAGVSFLHALRGWSPPASALHRLGVRTVEEIDWERYALKALRGDFGSVAASPANAEVRAQQALRAARRSVMAA